MLLEIAGGLIVAKLVCDCLDSYDVKQRMKKQIDKLTKEIKKKNIKIKKEKKKDGKVSSNQN